MCHSDWNGVEGRIQSSYQIWKSTGFFADAQNDIDCLLLSSLIFCFQKYFLLIGNIIRTFNDKYKLIEDVIVSLLFEILFLLKFENRKTGVK